MGVQHDGDWLTSEQYFERELTSEIRHEYLAGQIYAMAGASVEHNLIAGEIFAALHTHLAGKKCTVFMNDMRAHVELGGDDWFYYPDILVNCDPAGQKRFHCDTPTVIVEVLSDTTQRTDEREKYLVYPYASDLRARSAGSARSSRSPTRSTVVQGITAARWAGTSFTGTGLRLAPRSHLLAR